MTASCGLWCVPAASAAEGKIAENPAKNAAAPVTSSPAAAQAAKAAKNTVAKAPGGDLKKSCHDYVQRFYDYYIAGIEKTEPLMPEQRALNNKNYAFSPELRKRLKEDAEASAKSPGEIVGLDFDPFANCQDSPGRYVAAKVSSVGRSYLVDVYGIDGGKRSAQPAVTPELVYEKGKWVFVNFHYGKTNIPENENLLSVLKALAASRAQPAK